MKIDKLDIQFLSINGTCINSQVGRFRFLTGATVQKHHGGHLEFSTWRPYKKLPISQLLCHLGSTCGCLNIHFQGQETEPLTHDWLSPSRVKPQHSGV